MKSDNNNSSDNNNNNDEVSFTLPKRLFCNNNNNEIIIKSIDCHAGGEPARVIFSGIQQLVPKCCTTAIQKRKYIMDHLDYIRQILLHEPRGYPCQNVNYIFSSTSAQQQQQEEHEQEETSSLQYVIGEQNAIYPLMSGHNTICVATACLECGVIPMEEPITKFIMEAPAGPIELIAKCYNGKATSIIVRNTAPSFVEKLNVIVTIPYNNIGKVCVDIAFGGMWYAIVNIQQFTKNHQNNNDELKRIFTKLDQCYAKQYCKIGEMIKVACREQHPVYHPTENYPGVDILVFRDTTCTTDSYSNQCHNKTIFITNNNKNKNNNDDDDDNNNKEELSHDQQQQTEEEEGGGGGGLCESGSKHDYYYSKNTVVMSNNVLRWDCPETWTGMLDRSPCGTGTCAIMAMLYAKKELQIGQPFIHESIVGSKFIGTIIKETKLNNNDDDRTAIIAQIEGSAYITQYSTIVVDPTDPFSNGYRVSDIW